MKNERGKETDFFDLDPEIILAYRNYMSKNFKLIKKHKAYFLRDSRIPINSKVERLEELIDFLVLEGDFKKIEEIVEIKKALEIKMLINTFF
jgi:hypothetical protein